MNGKQLTITVEETAARLGISRGLAYEQVRLGVIPALRLGRRVVVPVRALEQLLEQVKVSSVNDVEDDSERAS